MPSLAVENVAVPEMHDGSGRNAPCRPRTREVQGASIADYRHGRVGRHHQRRWPGEGYVPADSKL